MTLPDFLAADAYGYIHLAGHRIGLRHVVELFQERYTPEMLLDNYPKLSLALINKVIAFYLENQAEVDSYVKKRQETTTKCGVTPQPDPGARELHSPSQA